MTERRASALSKISEGDANSKEAEEDDRVRTIRDEAEAGAEVEMLAVP